MNSNLKKFLGVVGIVAISASAAVVSTYSFLHYSSNNTQSNFNANFTPNPSIKLANYQGIEGVNNDFTVAAENSVHAVVHIKSTVASKRSNNRQQPVDIFDFFGLGEGGGRQQQAQPQVGFGSGVIISKDGYIVTNNHVIEGADEILVTLNDKRELNARLIGTDPTTDIALLKIEGNDYTTIPVGDSDQLKVGEWVLAVGNPFNLTSTVTAGIVSAKARNLNIIDAELKIESFIQTDAAVNPGNSGGALVNTRGELVGINTAIASRTGNFTGYSFAVPVSIMTKVIGDLKEYGSVQRAVLGVQISDITSALAKEKNLDVLEGVYVAGVVDGSSAQDAGIKEGDVIVAINGKKVDSASSLQELVGRERPGSKIKVKIVRTKKEQELTITLKNRQGNTKITQKANLELLGAAFAPISEGTKKELKVNYGLQISGVSNGKLQSAGIRKGFIILIANEEKISSEEELEAIVKKAMQSADPVLFLKGVYPSGKVQYYAVDLS